MTRAQALSIASDLYADHPAAVELLLVATDPEAGPERAERSRRALAHLDPDEPLGGACCSELRGPALAVTDLLMSLIYSADAEERSRVAGLLATLCAEAARIVPLTGERVA